MDIGDHADQIARALLGTPNEALSTKRQLRYGNNGSLAVEISGDKAGTWFDHEHEVGGGMLDLIKRERSCSRADALGWLKSIGIEIRGRGNGANGAAEQQRRAAVYIYRDEGGQPVFAVTRWAPLKAFTQSRHDPAIEQFIEGKGAMKGVRLVPYRLPELIASSGRIFVVEGEKDADRLAGLGLLATTNPGGAGKWPASFAQYFAGRDVVIIPDNDQAGRDHAQDVAAKLRGTAASVRILELPALLAKQDISNWLDAGYRVEQLEKLLQPEPVDPPRDAAVRADVAGDNLLNDVLAFLVRFVSYPSIEASRAHALWIAHAHLMDAWESTPRIAFLSPEPASGKTRALEVSELLVPRPVEAVNVSPAYLFRKVADHDGAPTILFDEIDTIFGPKAKDNEEIRGLLNAGHRRGAVTGRCVVRGKIVATEEIPAYCAVALAGLGWLPETLMTRAVVVRMRPRAPSEQIEPYRRRQHAADGMALHARLEKWAAKALNVVSGAWPEMPAGIEDRAADVWEPLLAVADVAGCDWPRLARAAAVALVTEARDSTPSLGIRLLGDLRTVFGDREAMATKDILAALIALDETPWADLKGKPLGDRGLAHRLRQYGIRSITVRVGYDTPKGYRRADFIDAWSRYLGPGSATSATSATSEAEARPEPIPRVADSVAASALVADSISLCATPEPTVLADVAGVADVADFSASQGASRCCHCHQLIQPGEQSIARDDGRLIHRACFAASFGARR